jgi:hypothetical protein
MIKDKNKKRDTEASVRAGKKSKTEKQSGNQQRVDVNEKDKQQQKPKLMGESETEIDDETTI